ncbi:MAG: hypothetical protein R3F49_00895 [Planctomycetota bacterium]
MLVCVGLTAVAGLLVLIALRLPYPFPLEWQEGAVVEHARRVCAGRSIYVEPSLDFAPFPYPPLFHWLGAVALWCLGSGADTAPGAALGALRGVSVLATLALLSLVVSVAVRRRTAAHGGPSPPLLRAARAAFAAGLIAAGSGFGGWFLDLARVDALMLACTVAAGLVAQRARSPVGALAAAVCAALAVMAKQTALLPCAALALGLGARAPRLAAVYGVALVTGLAVMLLWADALTDGWASFTIVKLLAGSPWHAPAVWGFWREASVAFAPVLLLPLGAHWRRAAALNGPTPLAARSTADPLLRPGAAGTDRCMSFLALGLAAAAWTGRAHEGGFDNTLLPLVVAVALIAPRWLDGRPVTHVLATVGLVWLAVVGGDPRAVVPTAAQRVATERAVEALRALPAPAFVPDAPDLAQRAGHPLVVHAMAIVDLLKSRERGVAQAFVERLEAALEAQSFGAVVLDEPWDLPALGANYMERGALEVPAPCSGAPRVPRLVYVRRR